MRVFRPALLAAGLGALLLPTPAHASAQALGFSHLVTAPIHVDKGSYSAAATARCRQGEQVTGGGVETAPFTTYVGTSAPAFPNLDGWTGRVGTTNAHGFTATSIVGTVYAICAPLGI
ncbi:hypothetical protein DN069_06495 [Streptacidiphilus pinicola]|uniref:Secreted protein n=1 Tax=Streptacidiphilus pinicola TaxID=2219663 RepID=A0A2X0J859_9ACTN|nr:hypothetical protein [Streptacidiphilus pinicola]RAG86456.1 hypothetical protein DN069_06495 [Streptacidiphilus pinicola]